MVERSLPLYQPPIKALTPSDNQKEFAFITLSQRLPVIITQLIDSFYRLASEPHIVSVDHSKAIIEKLAQCRYELQRNKPLPQLTQRIPYEVRDHEGDADLEFQCWQRIVEQFEEEGKSGWFDVPWLVSECFAYRYMADITWSVLGSDMGGFDWFRDKKEKSFHDCAEETKKLLVGLKELESTLTTTISDDEKKKLVEKVFHGSLWGNQADLSIHATRNERDRVAAQHDDLTHASNHYLLANDFDQIYSYLLTTVNSPTRVIHFILDNAGSELINDLVNAFVLTQLSMATKIVFHGKMMPWFVSDVMKHDFFWTIDQLELMDGNFVQKIKCWIESGVWEFKTHFFWTTHFPFCHLSQVAPDLFSTLSHEATLLIFKGDLNYRKLVYDGEWYPSKATTPFSEAIGELRNLPIVALRTCKADTVVGIRQDVLETVENREREASTTNHTESSWPWLATGRYGLISFSNPK